MIVSKLNRQVGFLARGGSSGVNLRILETILRKCLTNGVRLQAVLEMAERGKSYPVDSFRKGE